MHELITHGTKYFVYLSVYLTGSSSRCTLLSLFIFQCGGRFQSLTDVRAFPAQSARLCLLRYAQSQSSCTDRLLYRYGKQVAELR